MSDATDIGFQRPPAEPDKLVAAWELWTSSEEAPGRTMADLKIAGLDVILADLADQSEAATAMAEPWNGWERGKMTPGDALQGLASAGLGDLISAIAAEA